MNLFLCVKAILPWVVTALMLAILSAVLFAAFTLSKRSLGKKAAAARERFFFL